MELLNFLNTHSNWYKLLTSKPYNLDIKISEPYYLFKYNMLESDFSRPEVLQARGSIFYKDSNTGIFEPQSIAMHKFFNATEQYACTKEIDWASARVLEKCDGSLMKISYNHHNHTFLLSTNGSIYASEAQTQFGNTYEDAFIEVIGGRAQYEKFLLTLNRGYTYFFELVSKYNKICVQYEKDSIYYLGRRNMVSLEEDNYIPNFNGFNISYPRQYTLSSYKECQRAIEELGENEEGFVVCDSSFHRIKMKTPWYISMHRLRGNGVVTPTHILSLWQNDSLDDFIAAFPEYKEMIGEVKKKLVDLIEKTDIAFDILRQKGNRKAIALAATNYVKPIQSYVFARLDQKVENAHDYFKQMKTRNLAELIEAKEISK